MAVALAEAGADIIGVSASLETVKAVQVEKAVTEIGREFKAYTCDFSDRTALTVNAFAAQVNCGLSR